ncbi:unnamed protein product [Parnassius apollo]|uniref:(apollo) hypothetical protein n=1 Tax=Parnassius apollo TaxID=110799 RepID=A0A8S3XC70_PARAO|nr:unnamed protein product [Parnassius apollo]
MINNLLEGHTAVASSDRRKMDLRGDEERIRRWLCESDIESNHDEAEELSESENEDNMVADAHVGTDENEEGGSMSSDEEIFVIRRSRKRRFVGSDDNTSDTGQLGSESIQHQQEPQEPESSFVIRSNKNHLYGKSGYKWSTRPRNPRARTSSRNVIHVVSGPAGVAKEITDPRELFLLFISHEMINEMVTYTNTEIDIKKSKYKQKKYTNSHTSTNEVTALLGLLIQSATIKSNHLPTRTLFDHKRSAITFKACMSADRFEFLLRCLGFDDKTTRTERRASDKFAPFRQFWEAFISNCVKWYKPSSYIIIDEQLVGFRGRCPFRMYIPNKPNKYGLKFIMMADSNTKYLCNAIPYLGKGTNPGTEPLASYLVKEITKPIHGSN